MHCVEVAFVDHGIATRDSKSPDGGVLMFSDTGWASFLDAIKSDRFAA
jgi:hypothetical protein